MDGGNADEYLEAPLAPNGAYSEEAQAVLDGFCKTIYPSKEEQLFALRGVVRYAEENGCHGIVDSACSFAVAVIGLDQSEVEQCIIEQRAEAAWIRGGWEQDAIGYRADRDKSAGLASQHRDSRPPKKRTHRKSSAAQGPPWLETCLKGDTGKPLPILSSVLIGLRSEYPDHFAYDEMRCATVFKKSREPVTDTDIIKFQESFQLAGLKRIGFEPVFDAIRLHSRENSFHPVREHLAALIWDGIPRLKAWLTTYLGAEETEYTAAIGAMFLISMVARVMKPGCKADHMLVLEGEQGSLKSTCCRALAGDDYFSDNLPNLEDKDSSQHLRGKWLVEVAEMHSFDRAETTRLKSYITRQEERYRPSHARLEVHEPRQCVFIGTTNKEAYLRDETGGRRFWPVKTGKIDIGALRRDRNQLFAEALVLFNKGAKWWPEAEFERKHIKPQQAERYEADPWEEAIRRHVAALTKVTVGDVARAIGIETARVSKADQNRITATLMEIGWKRGKRTGASGTRYWERLPAADALTLTDVPLHRGSQKFSADSIGGTVSERQTVSAGRGGDSSPPLGPPGDSLDDFQL